MSTAPVDLPSFELAKLRAERVRIICMMVLFAAFSLLGLFRLIVPVEKGPRSTAIAAIAFSVLYLVFEAAMLRAVNRAVACGRIPPRWLGVLHAMLECLYPVAMILALMFLYPSMRFTLLVSPGYAFMLLLIGIAALRVDTLATALIGLFTTAGYGTLVACAFFAFPPGVQNPHPSAMYVNLALMLALAGLVAVFMTRQVRQYVLAAVREMEIHRQRDRLVRDLQIASEIQNGLLPRTIPRLKDYDLAASCRPAEQTGGDYYDWQEIGPRRVVISLADVTGHGVGPALVTAACRAYVRATMTHEHAPAVVLRCVNRLLHDDIPPGRFVTFALLDVDADAHEMLLLSAGHGPTLHVRAGDGQLTELGSQCLPLGVVDDQVMDEPVRIRPAPGDFVVLLSDGFLEQHNAAGEPFGMERFRQVLCEHRQDPAQAILEAMEDSVRAFAGDVAQEDDRTTVIIKRIYDRIKSTKE